MPNGDDEWVRRYPLPHERKEPHREPGVRTELETLENRVREFMALFPQTPQKTISTSNPNFWLLKAQIGSTLKILDAFRAEGYV